MSFFNGVSFKGILRGLVYAVIGGWMFFLGILVGRGTSPVTFDTKSFHNRLETIVQSYEKRDVPEEKMDLHFYDALNEPVSQEGTGEKNRPDEILPKKETRQIQVPKIEEIPVKTSRKAATLNKAVLNKVRLKESGGGLPQKNEPVDETRTQQKKSMPAAPGGYTIQVAAYKSFSDAVTQMAILEKKGFASYRVLGEKEGVTWYRVRVGSFATRDAAARYIEKLKHAKIEAMIIKKE